MELTAIGIDVLDRIERIEKLREDVKKIVVMNEKVRETNVYTVDDVINYAQHISGTVAAQLPYPRMPFTFPYPHHIPDGSINNIHYLEKVGWYKDICAIDESEEEERKEEKQSEMVVEDVDLVLMESSEAEEIL